MDEKFRIEEITQVFQFFSDTAEPLLYDYFRQKAMAQVEFIERYSKIGQLLSDHLNENADISGYWELLRNCQKEFLVLIMSDREKLSDERFASVFQEIEHLVNEKALAFPETILLREKVEKYVISTTDHLFIRQRKRLANSGVQVRKSFKQILSPIRNLFASKPADNFIYRTRKIPFRAMMTHFLVNQLALKMLDQYADLMKARSESLVKLWSIDQAMDEKHNQMLLSGELLPHAIADSSDELSVLKQLALQFANSNAGILRQAVLQLFGEFEKAYFGVGKVGLPAKSFKQVNLMNQKYRIEKTTQQTLNLWKNSHFTLFDDWAVDIEVTLIHYSLFDEHNHLKGRIDHYLNDQIEPALAGVSNLINASRQSIEDSVTSTEELRKTITEERKKGADELIDKLLPRCIELLSGCFTTDIEKLLDNTMKLSEKVSDKRAFIKNKKYDRPVRDSEINWVSPRELLNFEALPHFSENLGEMKSQTDKQLEKHRINLLSIGSVFDFNLEMALLMIDQNKDTPEEAVKLAVEGFSRSMRLLETTRLALSQMRDTLTGDIKTALDKCNEEILKLKNTEKILDLHLKIVRIRASEKAKQLRKETVKSIQHAIPEVFRMIKTIETEARQKVSEISIRLGFAKQAKFITFELTEFISQTKEALEKLPFVYQRIYQLSPTDEERFFVNRHDEINQLKQAFESWKKNRYITIAMIGDKGSGKTSVINYFLRSLEENTNVVKAELSDKIYTTEQYLHFFSNLLGQSSFQSNQELIDYLNELPSHRIIVLENLQHMYLKQIGGFDCLNLFFDLMANTMRKILWIGTFTKHSWNYLDKTIQIGNFFTEEIILKAMDKEVIEEIIFKRNRLSGYQIEYEPDSNNLQNKKFQKLADDERQDFLRIQFFTNLRRMSAGNISLAQLYWLRSTISVSEQTIAIGAINDKDFSFVKNLSEIDLFVLQTLLLHDGLTIEDFALVLNKSIAVSRNLMIPMFEKGILIKPRNKFTINPIIYKPVTDYLNSRNFIH